ncbi:MAG: RluA family pseudouridine synthase [Oscillospiraceae bacterium]|nr:RluA family pseudouridine synthase [Oscillospiraceae bacterium]
MRELLLAVGADEDGLPAAAFLKRHGFSRRIISSLKFSGGITRGDEILRGVDIVHSGENVRVVLEDSGGAEPNSSVKAGIAFEDEDVVVFEKPPEVPVHQSFGHRNDTLANLFAALYPERPFRAINRLDKNTTGLCVCAKNRLAASMLSGNVSKVYYAVIDGDISEPGEIDAPIARVSDSIILREVRGISEGGQPAVTRYEPIIRKNGRTLLKIRLLTGRTHQIRVHFSYIGYPLCGDSMYGGNCSDISRQALHCGGVEFIGCLSGEKIRLESPLPEDMKALLK